VRILLFGGCLSLRGTSIYTVNLARELKLRGNKVTLLGPGGLFDGALADQEIPILRAPVHGKAWRDWIYLHSYKVCAQSCDPDLLHVLHEDHAWIGSLLARKLGIPWVLTCHSQATDPLPLSPEYPPKIATVSEEVRRSLITTGRVPREWIDIVPEGVATNLSVLDETSSEEQLPVVGTVNRLAEDRGIDVFLRAARRVLDLEAEASFLVIGEGPDESKVRRLARELNLTPHLTFALPRARVSDLFRPIDIYVSASHNEGHGILLLSAMAEARPVIATSVGSVLSFITDGRNGLLVQRGDVEGLARRILGLLEDRECARNLGRDGFRFVRENFSLSQMLEGTLSVYRKALGEPSEETADL